MNEETKKCFILLKHYKNRLTKQQIKTFKGQILSENIIGFKKGLKKVLENKKKIYE